MEGGGDSGGDGGDGDDGGGASGSHLYKLVYIALKTTGGRYWTHGAYRAELAGGGKVQAPEKRLLLGFGLSSCGRSDHG